MNQDLQQRLSRLTPQQLALLQQKLAKGGAAPAAPADPAADWIAAHPLADGVRIEQAPQQQRLWFYERMQAQAGAYHLYQILQLHGALDVAALQGALQDMAQRHDALRLAFTEEDGRPLVWRAAQVTIGLQEFDLRQLAPSVQQARALQMAQEASRIPFDLSQPGLMRAQLLTLGAQEFVLILVFHHIVLDGWALNLYVQEFFACYHARQQGRQADLPPAGMAYSDWLHWQSSAAQQAQRQEQTAWWLQTLQGCPAYLSLPFDQAPARESRMRGARHNFTLEASLQSKLQEFANAHGLTMFMLYSSAFALLLARLCGQQDVVLGTPLANRDQARQQSMLGMLANTLALRFQMEDDPDCLTFLARAKAHFLEAWQRGAAPLEEIVDGLRPERIAGRAPLVQALFVISPPASGQRNEDGMRITTINPGMHVARFELTLSMESGAQGWLCAFDYDIDLFDGASIERMAQQWQTLLHSMLAQPDCAISRLPLLPPEQQTALLALGDGGPALDGPAQCLHELLPQAAARTPQAIALVDGARSWTYARLYAEVRTLAAHLQAAGGAPQQRIAFIADRSAEAVLALLAIGAVGAAYVPLDGSLPAQRLQFMLEDSGASLLLHNQAGAASAAATGVALLSIENALRSAPACDYQAPPLAAGSCAYVIYTSGSSGQPKGVMLSHAQVMNLVRGFAARHPFANQRLLMIPPLMFDASVGDLFPVIASSATLVLHPAPQTLNAAALQAFCQQQQVTAIDAPAALWRRWTDDLAALPAPRLPGLQLLMFGGEAVSLELVQRFAALTGQRVLLANHYGPTEAAVCATMQSTVDGAGLPAGELSIGTPLPGVRIYILDAHGQLVPQGAVGELCIAGAGVALGYLGLPEQNAQRFCADPFTPGARMYKSGDLARFSSAGRLHFIGRRDHQVKLRGFRIELGEIEHAANSCAGVQAAIAGVCEIKPGDQRLALWYVGAPAQNELRSELAQRLPQAMLPALFLQMAALPLTNNGKIDRRALPQPGADSLPPRSLLAPASAAEADLLAIWRDLLNLQEISCDDDFFAIGGDSLMTLPLAARIRQHFAIEFPVARIFSASSIVRMAQEIQAIASGEAQDAGFHTPIVLEQDIDPAQAQPARSGQAARRALVSGATGFLGAWLVRRLLDDSALQIQCLVRAENPEKGLQRIIANLQSYDLWRADRAQQDAARLEIIAGDLSLPMLGLSDASFSRLAQECDLIFHNGGQVNFLAPYEHMAAANVEGTRAILRLACSGHIKPLHFVSTLGVYFNQHYLSDSVRENSAPPLQAPQAGGYNQSKWAAESLVLQARARGLPCAIHRPARITGDSVSGAANASDYFSAWIKGCLQLGMLPVEENDSFDMIPVDFVAGAIVGMALQGKGLAQGQEGGGNWHYYNAQRLPVSQAAHALQQAGYQLPHASYAEWRLALQSAPRSNPLAVFAALYPETPDLREPEFDCRTTFALCAELGLHCPPADAPLFLRTLRFLQSHGALPHTAQEQTA
ncbi:amino acid adenylation domain-containing protein [Massilia sp. W12]|uniref:non-ribosomal peptide synthetase n=1 Tax=Massilia sp. W12 TaxID=3126507 RepID=UPI0030CCFBB8